MSSTVLTKVMLVDDHEIMRDGLREVLERSGDFEVVGEAGDGDSAVREAQNLKPDVIIMDVMMPLKDGIEACREITDVLPETKVLILTAASEEDAVVESFAAGATGGRCGVVVSGPDVGTGHPGGWLGPSQGWISSSPRSGCGCGKRGRGGRHLGPALNAAPAALRATESRFAVSFRHLVLRSRDHTRLETALPALSPGPGDRAG